MSILQSAKQYSGSDLETIFFRPILSGESAEELGIRILYNMPVPTTVHLWEGQSNILKNFTSGGWSGGTSATKTSKEIDMQRVKAELGFSAADYFSMVYERIATRTDANMDDLSGTVLEEAETELFKHSIAEGIRATMWAGDTTETTGCNTFDGFLKSIKKMDNAGDITSTSYTDLTDIVGLFDDMWKYATPQLQAVKGDNQLAFFVTSDVYFEYEKYLDSKGVDAAYIDSVNGRKTLAYHGIPVVDVRLSGYLGGSNIDSSFCILTDRRNLVLAVNTADLPGNEVRMWYNPDEMQNRQRAVFLAGCSVIDPNLVSYAYKEE